MMSCMFTFPLAVHVYPSSGIRLPPSVILSEAKNLAFRCQGDERSVLSRRCRRWSLDDLGASPLTLALDSRLRTSGMTVFETSGMTA